MDTGGERGGSDSNGTGDGGSPVEDDLSRGCTRTSNSLDIGHEREKTRIKGAVCMQRKYNNGKFIWRGNSRGDDIRWRDVREILERTLIQLYHRGQERSRGVFLIASATECLICILPLGLVASKLAVGHLRLKRPMDTRPGLSGACSGLEADLRLRMTEVYLMHFFYCSLLEDTAGGGKIQWLGANVPR